MLNEFGPLIFVHWYETMVPSGSFEFFALKTLMPAGRIVLESMLAMATGGLFPEGVGTTTFVLPQFSHERSLLQDNINTTTSAETITAYVNWQFKRFLLLRSYNDSTIFEVAPRQKIALYFPTLAV